MIRPIANGPVSSVRIDHLPCRNFTLQFFLIILYKEMQKSQDKIVDVQFGTEYLILVA